MSRLERSPDVEEKALEPTQSPRVSEFLRILEQAESEHRRKLETWIHLKQIAGRRTKEAAEKDFISDKAFLSEGAALFKKRQRASSL